MHAAIRWTHRHSAALALLAAAACTPLDGSAPVREASLPTPVAVRVQPPTPLTITVLNLPASVGGQAVLVSDSSGATARHVLIDGGEREQALLPRLRELGVSELALVVLSHPHTDHFGGLAAVVRELPLQAFAWNGDTRTLAGFRRLQHALSASTAAVLFVEDAPRTVTLATGPDTLSFTLLPPAPGELDLRGDGINNRSVGVRIQRGAFVALVPGDAEHGQLAWWSRQFPALLTADVLVASHHGSDDANATARRPQWYTTVTPSALLVSANGRQHPYANVLEFARQRGVATFCTHTHGDLVVRVLADGRWTVTPEREERCVPGTLAPR